jgi:hypothetical protein
MDVANSDFLLIQSHLGKVKGLSIDPLINELCIAAPRGNWSEKRSRCHPAGFFGLDKIKSEGKSGQIGLTLWKYEEMGQAAHLGLKYTTFPVGQESISPAR